MAKKKQSAFYEWTSAIVEGKRVRVFRYKGVTISTVHQAGPSSFVVHKLGHFIGEYPSSLKAMEMAEARWIEQ